MSLRKLLLLCVSLCLPLSANAADDMGPTLKRISESGRINLGYRVDQTPMSFDSGGNKPAGYSVELCSLIAIAAKAKLERPDIRVRYVPVTAENRFSSIQSGKIDMLCGATTKTLSRSEIVSFTQSTFATGGALLSRKDQVVDILPDLAGKKVSVVSNTTTIAALDRALKQTGIDAEVVPVASTSDGMDMLENGTVDAFAADQVVLIGQVIARSGRDKYALSTELFSFEPFALAITHGDAHFRLVADRVLSELNRSGEIINVYKRWLGGFAKEPLPALQVLYQLNSTPP